MVGKADPWFHRLSQDEQKIVENILRECAERTLANLLCLLDGVDGSYQGVFEIVAVNGDDRTVVNPENTEMLHDIFYDIHEEGLRESRHTS